MVLLVTVSRGGLLFRTIIIFKTFVFTLYCTALHFRHYVVIPKLSLYSTAVKMVNDTVIFSEELPSCSLEPTVHRRTYCTCPAATERFGMIRRPVAAAEDDGESLIANGAERCD